MKRSTLGRVASVALLAVLVGGCDSFLDVNEDPNAPENARPDVRFPPLVAGMVHSTYYGDPPLWGVEWTKQTSYNDATRRYDEIHLYEVQDNGANEEWSFFYADMLNESKLMMEELNPETDGHYYGITQFIHAWTWAITTDYWGPIPFTEALDPDIAAPAYDKQPVVYDAIMPMFDQAVSRMKSSAVRSPGNGDLLYGGDMSKWVKLARVVQARQHLRLSAAPWENEQEQAQAALAALSEGFTSNADDADFEYAGGAGARNPLWIFQDEPDFFKASEFMVELLQDRNDPRLPIMFEPAITDLEEDGSVVYRGHPNGGEQLPDSTISRVSAFFTAEDATLNVASYADAKFTEAEARLIVSGAAAADAPYRAGIRANMEKWGVAQADITAYLASRPSLGSVANPLREIIMEKYIANFLKVEPWHDWRRTGYPELQPVPGALLDGIPVRIRTPANEMDTNAENLAASGVPTGLDGMLWKSNDVWWGGN